MIEIKQYYHVGEHHIIAETSSEYVRDRGISVFDSGCYNFVKIDKGDIIWLDCSGSSSFPLVVIKFIPGFKGICRTAFHSNWKIDKLFVMPESQLKSLKGTNSAFATAWQFIVEFDRNRRRMDVIKADWLSETEKPL